MELLNLVLFIVCSVVTGLAISCIYFWSRDLWRAWNSPTGRDNGGETVFGNLLCLLGATTVGLGFIILGREAWGSMGGIRALSQLAAVMVGLVGFTLSALAVVSVPICIRDVYLAKNSETGRSPDGETTAANTSALLGAVIASLLLPPLTIVLVKVCLW